MRKPRMLLFSTLYPSSVRPRHAAFVETRLQKLLASREVEAKVVAPVPWFFSDHPRYGRYALLARTPRHELHNGVEVSHPRYLLPPAIGMNLAPFFMALGALPAVRKLRNDGFDFDVIDAHYYYPDGVAAALLARYFGRPFTVTARGSDLNVLTRYALPRLLMRWAAKRAHASIGVCEALVDELRGWDVDASRLHVMRNGVDLQRFKPLPRAEMRTELSLHGTPILLSVGNLVELKGHQFIIDALVQLLKTYPRAHLVIVGEGPDKARLMTHARSLGVQAQVTFAGAVENRDLARWYSAADLLVLASSSEGWANVLLEAMACGTPVAATAVGGSPEVVTQPDVGCLFDNRDAASIAAGVRQVIERRLNRKRIRAYAERFSWDATTEAQLRLFKGLTTAGCTEAVNA